MAPVRRNRKARTSRFVSKSEGGGFSFEIPPPSIRFVKTRFGHRITTLSSRNPSNPTNFAVLSVFRSHFRCESFPSAPFVAVQFPGGSESLVADSPGGRSPLSPWKIALPLIRIILASDITIVDSETFCYVEMKGLSVEIAPTRI